MPKAASVNWYALTKAANNPMEKQAISTYLRMMARLARMGRNVAESRVGQAVGGGLNTAYQSLRGVGGGGMGRWLDEVGSTSLPTQALVGTGLGAAGKGVYDMGADFSRGIYGLMSQKPQSTLQQILNSKYTPYAAAGLGTAGLLGGAAYMGSRAGKNDAKKKKKPEGEKEANLGLGAGVGAGLGGAAGALYGALAPGYEQDPDSGRRRRRSRLVAALRGLAGGAAAGGLAGGAVGHFAGPSIEKILGEYLAKKQQAGDAAESGLRTDVTMQADPVEAAKAEAMKQPAPPAIPQQGPMNANATLGGQLPPQPGVQNSMPPDMNAVQNVMTPPNPMPTQSPAIPQGPMNANATMGGMPAPQIRM